MYRMRYIYLLTVNKRPISAFKSETKARAAAATAMSVLPPSMKGVYTVKVVKVPVLD